MKLKGNKTNIKKFFNAISQEGNIYLGRGAECDYIEYNEGFALIAGWCKWSIYSALIDNAISMRTNPNDWGIGTDDKLEFITLIEASKKWNLEIEVFSNECGCCFAEHYLIKNGEFEINECVDYYEYYIYDFETKEEAENELEIEITDDEWIFGKVNEYFYRGGFECGFSI